MTIELSKLGERFENAADRSSARVPLADAGWSSEAGEILNLIHGGITGSVSVLKSKAGTRRASHAHRLDSHALMVVTGRVHYYERGMGETHRPERQVFEPGEMFFTPPMREHILYFPVDTVMVSLSDKSRTHEEHEADVIRVHFEEYD
jgi:hypothetical protein